MRNIKTVMVLFVLLLSSTLFASNFSDVHLKLENKINEISKTRQGAFGLKKVKNLAAGKNVEVKVSYERLIQANKAIWIARASFFPYRTGLLFGQRYEDVLGKLIVTELITGLPSRWFRVRTAKNLRKAREFNLYSVKENVKTEVAGLYFNILKEEALLESVRLEIEVVENLFDAVEQKVSVGLANPSDLRKVSASLLNLRNDYLKFKSLIIAEKSAFNKLLGLSPKKGEKLVLQPVSQMLKESDYNVDVENMVETSLNKSYELVSANYMVKAAISARRSTKWSILSFQGIGFGHFARVKVAKSKVKQAKYQRRIVRENLVNQVYSRESTFKDSLGHVELDSDMYDSSRRFMHEELEKYVGGDINIERLVESQRTYINYYRNKVVSHYNSMVNLERLKRVVRGPLKETSYSADDFTVRFKKYKWKKSKMWINSKVKMSKIQLVSFKFDRYYGELDGYSSKREFRIKFKAKKRKKISGKAKIVLKTGEVIIKPFRF